MDISTVLYAGLFGLVLAGATFGACYWWYGRRLRETLSRMEKLEVSRQTSTQHAQQARKQVEALQKELTAQREGRSPSATPRNRDAMEATLRQEEADRQATSRSSRSSTLPSSGFAATQSDLPPNGFAATEPMDDRGLRR